MYLHEAMKDVDRKEFTKATVKEVTDNKDNENYSIIPNSKVSNGATILLSV